MTSIRNPYEILSPSLVTDGSKLDGLKSRQQRLEDLKGAEREEQLWAVAEGFEEMFLNVLMRSMRGDGKSEGFLGESYQTRMVQDMYYSELAHEMSRRRESGVGIAPMVYEFLSGERTVQHKDNTLFPRVEPTGKPGFVSPVSGRVSSEYGPRIHPISGKESFHDGIDIAAPAGTPIRAARSGKVLFAGERGGYGNVVVVDHGAGLKTLYAHNSRNIVKAGDTVKAGQVIGTVGSTGRSTGPHLHFEVRQNGEKVNPAKHLGRDS